MVVCGFVVEEHRLKVEAGQEQYHTFKVFGGLQVGGRGTQTRGGGGPGAVPHIQRSFT